MKTLGEILKVARNRLNQGWVKGTTYDGSRVCALGALYYAQMGRHSRAAESLVECSDELNECIAATMDERVYPRNGPLTRLMAFNDLRETTKADVLAQFDRMIDYVEKKHDCK